MTNFLKAYAVVRKHEGGYDFDPDDAGGETFKGISRVYEKTWSGWKIIDAVKSAHPKTFKRRIENDEHLQTLTEELYKWKYWDCNMLDEIADTHFQIAQEMFDTGVNLGTHRAAKYLQMGLNYLNRNEKLYSDLTVDGLIGKKSLRALDKLSAKPYDLKDLYKIMNIIQGQHYLNYMSKSEKQEKYCRGWLDRVDFIKS